MVIKKLFLILVVLGGGFSLQAMQQELSQEKTKQFYRFPGFVYFQPHPEVGITANLFSREALQLNMHILQQYNQLENLQDSVNYVCALYIAQAVLLTKSIEEWTPEDIQKINALVVNFDAISDETIRKMQGSYRCGMSFYSRFGQNTPEGLRGKQFLNHVRSRATGCFSIEDLKRKLSPEEWAQLNNYYRICPYNSEQIPQAMNECMRNLRILAQQNCPSIKLATFIHQRATDIHPFIEGNGRTSRILSFGTLSHGRRSCFTINKPEEYTKAASQDIEQLASYFNNRVEQTEEIFSTYMIDLDGFALDTPLDATEVQEIKSLFYSFKINEPQAKKCIRALKEYVQKKLNIFNQACQVCGKTDGVKKCSRCSFTKYCGIGCQKDDWECHKLICPLIHDALIKNLDSAKKS